MSWLCFLEEAQLHREVYIAVLNGLLKARGSKQALAKKVGITPQYLSYILDPWNIRTPSPKVAEAIVAALPLPLGQKHVLLEHMILANERRVQMHGSISQKLTAYDLDEIDEILRCLRETHQQAMFTADPSQAKVKYKLVYEMSSFLIRIINPRQNPLAFVELCFLGHDSGCVLNRQIDALWFAKQARFVVESAQLCELRQPKEIFIDSKINAIRAEAVSYHNLKLFKPAYYCCEEAEELLATRNFKGRYDFWKPHLLRDKINALVGMPRFAITEAEGLAHQVEKSCEKDIYTDEEKELLVFLIRSSLSRAYIKYGGIRNWRKAEHLLRTEFERMGKMERIGPLHQTLLMRTYARLRWMEGDQEGWRYFINHSIKTAIDAGLDHQIQEIHHEYGKLVEPFLQGF